MLTPAQVTKAKSTKLSPDFSLWELIRSDRHGKLVIYPCPCIQERLRAFANKYLQAIRAKWGRLRVNSGYRNPLLNEAVGGVADSIHQILVNDEMLGVATDVDPLDASLWDVFEWCNPENLPGLKTAIIYPDDEFIHLDDRSTRASFARFKKVGKDYIAI